jgi:hypothetical protein
MQIITKPLTRSELKEIAGNFFGDMVKGVVDIERRVLAVDAELHADIESLLLQEGSAQKNLWGINLYPEASGEEFLEFNSMINIRPSQGNRSRGVDDPTLRAAIRDIVFEKIRV